MLTTIRLHYTEIHPIYILLLYPTKLGTSRRDRCQLDSYKSEPYLTYPLLSALTPTKPNTLLSLFFQHYKNGNQRTFPALGYGQTHRAFQYYGVAAGSHSDAIDLTASDGSLSPNVRLASLGLAAKSIFKDIVIRPLAGITRFFKTTGNVLDWNET